VRAAEEEVKDVEIGKDDLLQLDDGSLWRFVLLKRLAYDIVV